jgi:Type II secretion system (T2SS), protein M subtype b
MAFSPRERQLSLAVLLVGAVFLCDRIAVSPYLERRMALIEDRERKTRELTDVRQVLGEERRLRHLLIGMSGSVRADVSTAEGQFLSLIHDWERQAGIGKASFQRTRAAERYGFTHLTFQVSASGPLPAVATLIYLVETAPIPLRVDELVLTPGRDGGELHVQFSVSTLCRQVGPTAPQRAVSSGVAAIEPAGGRR